MKESSPSVSLRVGEVIKEVKETQTVEEVDKTSALIVRAIHAALSPLEKWVIQREYNLAETKKLLEFKLKNVPVENIITPPSYVAVPALQSISYCMNDEQLRDMYAELLAHSMNTATMDIVHPTYVEIIKQMSPFDALVFKELVKILVIPCIGAKYVNKKTKSSYPIYDIVVFQDQESFPVIPTQISLENLERLRLIEVNKLSKYDNPQKYKELEHSIKSICDCFIRDNSNVLNPSEYEVVFDEYVVLIRGFGQFFARACLDSDFKEIS